MSGSTDLYLPTGFRASAVKAAIKPSRGANEKDWE